MPETSPVNCVGCRHLVFLYEPGLPYACRHVGIRSRRPPHLEVLAASGAPCAAREEREAPGRRRSSRERA